MTIKYAVSLLGLLAGLAPVIGRGAQLGEPAPPLMVKEWIKGKPVEVKAGTNIIVVDIFTTSSLACRASITNLNEAQKRFQGQGLVVVGVSEESPDQIRKFLQQEGAKIEYAIAADDQRQTSLKYMMPVHQRGVPCAFVVGKDGRLLWYGNPLYDLDKVLDQIITGHYDVEQAARIDLARNQMRQYLAVAHTGDPRVRTAGLRLLAARTNNVALLCDLAFQISTAPGIAKRDFALADAALNQAEKVAPTNSTRVAVTRAVLLFESGRKGEGLALARQTIASARDPKEKANAEACLRTMEARFEAAKTNRTTKATIEALKTNQTNQPAVKP